MSQPAKGKSKQRGAPPTLFIHPSPQASNVSLPGVLAPGAPTPASSRTAAAKSPPPPSPLTSQSAGFPLQRGSSFRRDPALPLAPLLAPAPRSLRHSDTRATDRTDALWAEMQATLEEVELSASGGTRVFGPDHDRKLAELRAAQIALAQAWARSEADEAIGTAGALATGAAEGEGQGRGARGGGVQPGGGGAAEGKGDGPDGAKSTTGTGSQRPGSSGLGAERIGAKLEEETEVDILLARKRREANDRYFQRVNHGVLDVIAKLEEVATAMQAVEQESKDVWGDNESAPSSAKG